jgi:hypothetical protein
MPCTTLLHMSTYDSKRADDPRRRRTYTNGGALPVLGVCPHAGRSSRLLSLQLGGPLNGDRRRRWLGSVAGQGGLAGPSGGSVTCIDIYYSSKDNLAWWIGHLRPHQASTARTSPPCGRPVGRERPGRAAPPGEFPRSPCRSQPHPGPPGVPALHCLLASISATSVRPVSGSALGHPRCSEPADAG